MRRRILFSALLCMAVSCVYPYDVPELQQNETRLLVDGNIIVGGSASLALYTVILGNTSGTVPRSNTFRVYPDTWWVEDDKNVKYGFNDEGILDLSDAPSDRMYRIVFKYKGKTYSSSFEKHLNPPEIREISFDADDFTVYCRVSFDEGSGGSGFAAVRSDEIWNYHTDFEKSVIVNPATWEYVDVKSDSLYYCWYHYRNEDESIVDLRQMGGKAEKYVAKSFSRFGSQNHREYNIRVYVRSISEAEYRFKKNIGMPQGGYNLFTPNPGDVSGNVRCESENGLATLGYVTSSSYATIDGKLDTRFRKTQPINYDNYIKLESSDDIQLYYEVYHMVPIFRTWGAVYWGGEECLDCRLRGGTLEKPSF